MNRSAWSNYINRRYFNSLDGIRAIAILSVLWHHSGQAYTALPMTSRGFLGVDLFFVLSGFLIVTLLLRERDRKGDISLYKFYMRRTLRIFPVYYAVLLGLTILFGIIARNSDMAPAFLAGLPWYLTYTSNFIREESLMAVAWSLATEEQFYLVWPPLEKFVGRAILPILGVLLVINQLINYEIIFVEAHARLEVLQSTFTPILLGVLLAHALHNEAWYNRLARALSSRWATAATFGALLVFLNLIPVGSDISGTPRLIIHLLMTAFMAACVLNEEHVLLPAMTQGWVKRVGVVSYGMYLFHMLIVVVVSAVLSRVGLEQPLVRFVLVVIITYLVSELSFRFYETPFLRLKERWATHPTPQAG